MLLSVFVCREMCTMSRWVPSCYVMYLTVERDVCCEQMSPSCYVMFDCKEICAVSKWVASCYVICLTVQRDVCCEQMSPIMLCNVFDCAERCVMWADHSHHAGQCDWLPRDVSCEQMSPIMLCNVFDCREMCAASRWVPSCCTVCLTAERCVLWAVECHHAMLCVWLQRDACCEQMSPIKLWADESHQAM